LGSVVVTAKLLTHSAAGERQFSQRVGLLDWQIGWLGGLQNTGIAFCCANGACSHRCGCHREQLAATHSTPRRHV